MHTGRNDEAKRQRSRRIVSLADDDSDKSAGFLVTDDFRGFSQVDDVFCRSQYDPSVKTSNTQKFYDMYRRPLTGWRGAEGYAQHDYALRNATWHVADIFAELYEPNDRRDGFLDPLSMLREGSGERVFFPSSDEASRVIKQAATTVGADLVGITNYDSRWTYTERFSMKTLRGKENPIPEDSRHVIVIGQAMDTELLDTAPSALSGSATGMGYSQDALVLLTISQFIRNLGYEATPSMNDTAIAIPYAVKAGLGEYGKHGLVITPEFGTSVRFGKIFTNLPLTHDLPIRFGVQEMCELCNACSKACPSKAIPDDKPSFVTFNRSNIAGVKKWTIDGEKCFSYWAKINTDCAVCVRVCPFTRDYTKIRNRLWLRLAHSSLRKLALALDQKQRRGKRVASRDWWLS
ncbi:MAG: reductive dehalogenase [Acidimicrobiaceae bacterium]|nr:reductive dehalogenase [Acidimicrobiaceae bacterium]|tara:strand:+ start:959 stop:2173 length:1215 start_codon:yes stop_codon:yes gene_type:complete